MSTNKFALDPTTPALSIFDFASRRASRSDYSDLLRAVHRMRGFQRNYYKAQDTEIKKILLVACKQMEREVDLLINSAIGLS